MKNKGRHEKGAVAAMFAALCISVSWIGTGMAAESPSPKIERPRIAVVIDDFGLNYPKDVSDEDWLKAPFPMTFAVMPRSPRTRQAALRIKGSDKELIIHFPFDPFLSLQLPAGEASESDKKKVAELLNEAFKTIPGAVGLNTHRSDRATANRPLMNWFMGQFKARGVYFLDSHVSPKTVAFDEAKQSRILAASNSLFLDGLKEPRARRSKDPEALKSAIRKDKEYCMRVLRMGASMARKRGSAIVIGHHYFHGTYEGLMELVPELQKEGFDFVFASQLAK